jgi:hypothetical protein
MQLKSLLENKDIKYEIMQYFDDVETKLFLGKVVNENFLNYFNFNIDYDDIRDISKIIFEPIKITCDFSIINRYKIYSKMAELSDYDKCNKRSKTSNMDNIIKNSIDTLYAYEKIKLIEFYNDIDIQKYEVEKHIISNIKKFYINAFSINIDVSKFCTRCAKFGHEALKVCNGCSLFDEKYEIYEDKLLYLMNEKNIENELIHHAIQTKINSEYQFNEFIEEHSTIVLKEFKLIEPNKIHEEIELYQDYNPKTSYTHFLENRFSSKKDDYNYKSISADKYANYGIENWSFNSSHSRVL